MALTKHPNAPSNLRSTSKTATSVNLAWNAVDVYGGIKEYRLFRNNSLIKTVNTTTANDTGLSASTEYSYKVQAVSKKGLVSAFSPIVKVTTNAAT